MYCSVSIHYQQWFPVREDHSRFYNSSLVNCLTLYHTRTNSCYLHSPTWRCSSGLQYTNGAFWQSYTCATACCPVEHYCDWDEHLGKYSSVTFDSLFCALLFFILMCVSCFMRSSVPANHFTITYMYIYFVWSMFPSACKLKTLCSFQLHVLPSVEKKNY